MIRKENGVDSLKYLFSSFHWQPEGLTFLKHIPMTVSSANQSGFLSKVVRGKEGNMQLGSKGLEQLLFVDKKNCVRFCHEKDDVLFLWPIVYLRMWKNEHWCTHHWV